MLAREESRGLPWQCYLPVAFVFRAEIATKNLYTRGQKRSPKKSRRPRFRDEDLNVLFFLVRQGCAQHPLEHHSGRLCKRRDFLQILWVICSNSACLEYTKKSEAQGKNMTWLA